MMQMNVLIFDTQDLQRSMLKGLIDSACEADTPNAYFLVDSISAAENIVKEHSVDLAVIEISDDAPQGGLGLIRKIRKEKPLTVVVAVCYRQNPHLVRDCLRLGAFDAIFKPLTWDAVTLTISKVLAYRQQLGSSEAQLVSTHGPSDLSTRYFLKSNNQKFQQLLKDVKRLAGKRLPVMITGESGTGKEVLAEYVWSLEGNPLRPFIPVNCGAISENLVESSLFGHVKGSFTGATSDKTGYFQDAAGGDIFLDEVSTMPLKVQVSLLRTLNSGEVLPVGATRGQKINFRVISASNENLEDLIQQKRFRDDLLHRLKGVEIELPPLRERKEDIPELVRFFLMQKGLSHRRFSDEALSYFMEYHWPGNVRQLEKIVFVLGELTEKDVISADEVRQRLRFPLPKVSSERVIAEVSKNSAGSQQDKLFELFEHQIQGNFSNTMRDFEQKLVRYALERNRDYSKAARFLGISRSLLLRRLSSWGWTSSTIRTIESSSEDNDSQSLESLN